MPHVTARKSLVQVPEDHQLGPRMQECSPAERAYIIAYLETGGRNHTQAAIVAGIGGNRDSAAVSASRMMRKQRVLDAMKEVVDAGFQGDVFMARAAMQAMVLDPNHTSHFKAVESTLNRAGMIVAALTKVEHNHTITLPTADLRKQLESDLKLLGMKMPDVIDAEFEEVGSSDGLEDLL